MSLPLFHIVFSVSMQNHSRTSKTCFTLGLECLCLIYKSWGKEGQYYKGNLFGFKMGPSVKFVSAIIDAFSNKKMGVNFFHRKKPNLGRGVRGGFGKRSHFSGFFSSATFPNLLMLMKIWNLKLEGALNVWQGQTRRAKATPIMTTGSKFSFWLLIKSCKKSTLSSFPY